MKWIAKSALIFLLAALPSFASASELAILQNGYSIQHERREIVGTVTRLYLGGDDSGYIDIPTEEIDHFEVGPPTPAAVKVPLAPGVFSKADLDQAINSASAKHRIDSDLIASVIRAESGFNPHAISPKGAQGLMQLMPKTASQLGVEDAFDAGSNVEAGTRYLRELLEQYNFDLIKALAAYNAGPLRVKQYHGVPPYAETRAYVARIIRDFNQKKLAQEKALAASKKASHNSARVQVAAAKPNKSAASRSLAAQ